jgi:hypothetical protein
MTALTLNFSAVSDVNPYVFPAGWTVIKDSFKVQSNSLRSVFSDTGQSMVITDNPATSGLLDVSLTVVQTSGTFNDWSGMLFVNASGNGFGVEVRDNHIYVVNIAAGAYTTSITNVAGLTYLSGAEFRATYDLDTDDINVYQLTTAPGVPTGTPGTPVLTATGLTPVADIAGGLWVVWENGNAAGIITASVDGFASITSIDTLTTDGNPGLVVGQPFAMTTTGLGTITGITITTAATPTAATDAINLALPSGDGTGEMKDWVDAEFYAYPGTGTVEATDGILTASGSYALSMPDDTVNVIFADVETTDNTYIGTKLNDLGHPLQDGDIGYYPTGNGLAIGTNGHVSCLGAMVFVLWIQKLDGVMEMYNVTINDAGEITDVTGITSRGITSRGITSRNITSRGLS